VETDKSDLSLDIKLQIIVKAHLTSGGLFFVFLNKCRKIWIVENIDLITVANFRLSRAEA
jgi:hypothetical protein